MGLPWVRATAGKCDVPFSGDHWLLRGGIANLAGKPAIRHELPKGYWPLEALSRRQNGSGSGRGEGVGVGSESNESEVGVRSRTSSLPLPTATPTHSADARRPGCSNGVIRTGTRKV